MVTRSRRLSLAGVALLLLAAVACEKVPLLAPSGSSIVLTAPTNALSASGTTTIVAQILESAGTPPHSGTHVTFTTTLGRIEPSEAATDTNGRVSVTFTPNGASGTAVITAGSGGATTGSTGALRIAVGSAAVGRVIVVATPNPVSANGGVATITANVVDLNGNALPSVGVSFAASAGSLGSSLVNTDASGVAQTTLTTSMQSTVTATVGVSSTSSSGSTGTGTGTGAGTTTGSTSTQVSGTVTVNVSAAPSILITPPNTPPSKGLPATYAFVVTAATANGSAVRNVSVDWGDGMAQDLGSFTGSQAQTHVYSRDGSFQISATVTDISGNSNTTRTTVTVIPVPRPTVTVTATPQTVVNGTVTFNIQVLPPTGIGVQKTSISYGDGVTEDLGGATSVTRTHQYSVSGQKAVTVTVLDTAGQTTEGTTSVSVTP